MLAWVEVIRSDLNGTIKLLSWYYQIHSYVNCDL